jgi:hypothetical protein
MEKLLGVFLILFTVMGCGSFGGVFSDPDVLNALTEGFQNTDSGPPAAQISYFTFTNESSYKVTFVVGISSFSLSPGMSTPVAAAFGFDTLVYSPEDNVDFEIDDLTVRFFDR